jgi:curved DNA-binding protein CbpA
MTRSLYSILNVSPDADPAVIEAAYKALMKKHHPDMLVGEPQSIQGKAAEINRAFQTLRDPERRAHYDSQEQARQNAIRAAQNPDMRQMQFQHAQPQRRSKWPALLLIAVLAALALYVWQMTEGTERDRFASVIPVQGARLNNQTAAVLSTAFPAVDPADVDRAIAESRRVIRKMGLMGLSGYSQDCFASLRRSAKLAELDFCVAFDSAASIYDAASAQIYSLPQLPRFNSREMMARHLSAAKTVSEDDAWVPDRLAQVRSLTNRRLEALNGAGRAAEDTVAASVAAPVAAPPAASSAERPKVVRAERPHSRSTAPRPARPRQNRASDADFLERQGYIY